jgi:ABC-type antimicrobial peptide transport system permease subunit
MNIGTFKAFGMSNGESRNIYFMIIALFMAITLAAGLLLAILFGYILNAFLTMRINLEDGLSYFRIMDGNTALTLGIILAATLAVSWITIRAILSKSPGDLIYNR